MAKRATPTGWLWCELKELLLPVGSPVSENFLAPVLYIEISSIDSDAKRVNSPRELPPADLPTRARYVVRPGDVLFGLVRPYLKSIAEAPDRPHMVASSAISVLRPIQGVSSRFIFYLLQSDMYMDGLLPLQRGASYPAVTDSDVKAQEVMLPPPRDQDLIVQQLDIRLGQLDRQREDAKSAQETIATRRRALYDNVFAPPFSEPADLHGDRVEAWSSEALGALLELASYGTSTKTSPSEHGSPVLRIPNIARGGITFDPLHYSAQRLEVGEEERLAPGDILVVRSNGSIDLIGTAAIVRDLPVSGVHFASYLIRLRVNEAKLSPEWVVAFFSSTRAREWMERASGGSTTQHNLSLRTIRSMMIPLPPRVEQEELLRQLQAGLRALEEDWAAAQDALVSIETSRQQLLNQAVTGNLVQHAKGGRSAKALLTAGIAERTAAGAAQDRKRRDVRMKRKEVHSRKELGIESIIGRAWQSGDTLYSTWLGGDDHSVLTAEQFFIDLNRGLALGLLESRAVLDAEGLKVGDEFRLLPGTGALS